MCFGLSFRSTSKNPAALAVTIVVATAVGVTLLPKKHIFVPRGCFAEVRELAENFLEYHASSSPLDV